MTHIHYRVNTRIHRETALTWKPASGCTKRMVSDVIDSYSFGQIVVNGTADTNDIKIIDESVIPEWWRKSGHTVAPEDVIDLVQSRPEIVVIGKGKPGFMSTSSEARRLFADHEITLLEEKTSQAIQTFNRLHREGKKVCAGFHLTC